MPMSRGTASGHATSNSAARPRPASRQTGAGVDAQRIGQGGREEVRPGQEHDRDVLGEVAHVLHAPVGVVAQRRVGDRLQVVEVVVRRVQEVAGRRRRCRRAGARSGAPRRGPPTSRAATTTRPTPRSTRNGAATTTVSRAVQARPNSSPIANWRRSTATTSRQPSNEGRRRTGGASGSSTPGSSSWAAGSAPSANPTASSARPTATMWAWYQVVASCGGVPEDGPEREEDGRRQADRRRAPGADPASTSRSRRRRRRAP